MFEIVTFDGEAFRAVVNGVLQRPQFNSRGAATAFAVAVVHGLRKGEPV
jgi:hypothetical protein